MAFLPATPLSDPPVSRGDTFSEVEEVEEAATIPPEKTEAPTAGRPAEPTPTPPPAPVEPGPSIGPVDADAEPCSGRPFDAFLQLKNTSIYAFRGKHRHREQLPAEIQLKLCLSSKGTISSSWMTGTSFLVIPNSSRTCGESLGPSMLRSRASVVMENPTSLR